jgi:hypothetical protein
MQSREQGMRYIKKGRKRWKEDVDAEYLEYFFLSNVEVFVNLSVNWEWES